jgi:hypothetical protein
VATYDRPVDWENAPSTATPVNQINLRLAQDGVAAFAQALVDEETAERTTYMPWRPFPPSVTGSSIESILPSLLTALELDGLIRDNTNSSALQTPQLVVVGTPAVNPSDNNFATVNLDWQDIQDTSVTAGGATEIVAHTGTTWPPRPATQGSVLWIGPVVSPPSEMVDGDILLDPNTAGESEETGGPSGHVIQDESASLTPRAALAFQGSGVTATDDSANDRTIVTIPGATRHTILDETTPLTPRSQLAFQGTGVSAADQSVNDRTVITVTQIPQIFTAEQTSLVTTQSNAPANLTLPSITFTIAARCLVMIQLEAEGKIATTAAAQRADLHLQNAVLDNFMVLAGGTSPALVLQYTTTAFLRKALSPGTSTGSAQVPNHGGLMIEFPAGTHILRVQGKSTDNVTLASFQNIRLDAIVFGT